MSYSICWVITGAGHLLAETVEYLLSIDFCTVDLHLTRAGREVALRYGQMDRLKSSGREIFFETDASSSRLIFFSSGRYDALVIAPATSNTVAKCALGIADSMASNFFAQAGKSGIPIYILPTDTASEMTSVTPSGKKISVRPREIDLKYTDELSRFPGVTLVRTPEEVADSICQCFAPEAPE
ncbi:MAG: flavoprotein [Synergistaceae bacterium]|jgi:flavoprotein|nr:flavoprotein [Synergistaceae bacterium]